VRRRAVLTVVDPRPAVGRYLRPAREIVVPTGRGALPGPWFERGPLDGARSEHGLVVEVTPFGSDAPDAPGRPERLP
jgi:hypothetical protein